MNEDEIGVSNEMSIEGWDADAEIRRKILVDVHGHVIIALVENVPHYKVLAHGVNTIVWTPTSGYHLRITGLLTSAEGAGTLELFKDATAFATLHFNEKRSVPLPFSGDLCLDEDEVLKATFTADNASDGAFITAIGHEHE